MKDKTYRRHIAKAVTWRTVGTIDTFLLSWFISGDPFTGLKIGMAEVITKMILYYLHERLWFRIRIGVNSNGNNSKKRHLAKTVTWRVIGTLDTMTLAWLISGDAMIGLQIGAAEVITKMLLYYFHERLWYRSDYGLDHRNTNELKEGNPGGEL